MTVEIDDQSKIFDFPEGRSHFIGVTVPRVNVGRKLEVRTWHRGNSKFDQQIFCPALTLLDGNKQVINTAELSAMEFTRAGFVDNARFTQVLTLPDSAEYVIVHTSARSLGQRATAPVDRRVAVIVLNSGVYVSPGSGSVSIPCGQQGRITLQLK